MCTRHAETLPRAESKPGHRGWGEGHVPTLYSSRSRWPGRISRNGSRRAPRGGKGRSARLAFPEALTPARSRPPATGPAASPSAAVERKPLPWGRPSIPSCRPRVFPAQAHPVGPLPWPPGKPAAVRKGLPETWLPEAHRGLSHGRHLPCVPSLPAVPPGRRSHGHPVRRTEGGSGARPHTAPATRPPDAVQASSVRPGPQDPTQSGTDHLPSPDTSKGAEGEQALVPEPSPRAPPTAAETAPRAPEARLATPAPCRHARAAPTAPPQAPPPRGCGCPDIGTGHRGHIRH